METALIYQEHLGISILLIGSNVSFNQTSLKTIDFEPPVGVVLAQHACHKLFSKEKIVKKING